MKAMFTLMVLSFSFQSFALSVVDSMYEIPKLMPETVRTIASEKLEYCLVGEGQRVFAKSCYSSASLCEKRLAFWADLPGSKQHSCKKI